MFKFKTKTLFDKISRLFWPSSITITLTGCSIVAQRHSKSDHQPHVITKQFTQQANTQNTIFFAEIDAFLCQIFTDPNWQKRGVRILLGADLVRYFVVQPFNNARHQQDGIDAAAHRFQHLYGADDLKEWDILGHWSIDHRFLACAVPKRLLQQLNHSSQNYPFQMDAITPQFVSVWNCLHHHLNSEQWLLVNEGTHICLGLLDHDGLVSVRVISRQAQSNIDAVTLSEIIKREAFSFDLLPPATVVLCGDMEAQWCDCEQPVIIQSNDLKRKNTKDKGFSTEQVLAERRV